MHSLAQSKPGRVLLTAAAILIFIAFLQAQNKAQRDFRSTASEIQAKRASAYESVSIAKKQFKVSPEELVAAQNLYGAAESDYARWSEYVYQTIEDGATRHLNNEPEYKDDTDKLSKSAKAFTDYVSTTANGPKKAVDPIFTGLFGLGIQLWNSIKTQSAQQRDTAAKDFLSRTAWQHWDQIPDGTAPESPASPDSSSSKKPSTPTK